MPGTFTYNVSRNPVTLTGGISGSPADFASLVTADRANAATLLAAWCPNNNTKALSYQGRPVEKLARLISFVVANKTAETDYIYITGMDWLGNAQTEGINVSALTQAQLIALMVKALKFPVKRKLSRGRLTDFKQRPVGKLEGDFNEKV
jgi:hypothetical protein